LNYAIPHYYLIIKKLKAKRLQWGDSTISLASKAALDKLNEYYNYLNAYSNSSIATICDPRFNFSIFSSKLLPELTESAKRAKIMSYFKNCFAKYEDRKHAIGAAKVLQEAQNVVDNDNANQEDDKSDAELFEGPTMLIDTQTKWSKWIKQSTVPQQTNILQYWKSKQYEFPIVAEIARDHLAIPATSAPSECVFSSGGDIITKKRNRLSGETVRYIMCLKS
jgi:hypothetical protein